MMATIATAGAVRTLVSDTVFKRGRDIESSDKIRSIVFEGDNLSNGSAECVGSSPVDLYNLSVSINGNAAVGKCSCPAGKCSKDGLCKHVVALLLKRVHGTQRSDAFPPRNTVEDELKPVTSEIDKVARSHDVGAGRAAKPSSSSDSIPTSDAVGGLSVISGGSVLPANSRRALPSWMLGVVGSATVEDDSVQGKGSKKRAVPPRPVRPPPAPVKRARRSEQGLRISHDNREGTEGPGEDEDGVEDDGPTAEQSAPPPVVEDPEVDAVEVSRAGAAARERRRLKALRKDEAELFAGASGHDGYQKTRGRPSRAEPKSSEDLPGRKGSRLPRKYLEDGCNVLENCFDLTDDDLVSFAQEQMEREKDVQQEEYSKRYLPTEPILDMEKLENSYQAKKRSTIFSLNKWKEHSAAGRGTIENFNSSIDDLNCKAPTPRLELKGNSDLPSSGSQDIPMSIPGTGCQNACDQTDEVANEILDLLFGTSLCRSITSRNAPGANPILSCLQEDLRGKCTADTVFAPFTRPSTERVDICAVVPSTWTNIEELHVDSKPKKKSSLKDKVKMLLS